MLCIVVTLPTLHPPTYPVYEVAPENIKPMLVTLSTCQLLMLRLNERASENMLFMSVTLPTSQLDSVGEFITVAPRNICRRLVTADRSGLPAVAAMVRLAQP